MKNQEVEVSDGFATRAQTEVEHIMDKSFYALISLIMFLGVVPPTRQLIGVLLRLIGGAIEAFGVLVLQEAERVESHQMNGTIPFVWVLGLFLLLSPYLVIKFVRVQAWKKGMEQAHEEGKAHRRIH